MEKHYDYLIVGAGLFGAVFARLAADSGKTCLVVERRDHIGGNIYTTEVEGITVHRYGAHIFHTANEEVWAFVRRYAEFNDFVNTPLANYEGTLYNLPFNMNTFRQMWGVTTPEEAQAMIAAQRAEITDTPKNLEEQAISLVGRDIYEKLVRGYTEKQWGRSCTDLPPFIIRRLPVRFTYDNNYFNDPYQGIPVEGYTAMTERLLEGVEVRLGVDYLTNREALDALADAVVYTGPIDAYYDYCYGALEYRSLRFEDEILPIPQYQPVAVVNYNEREIPYTRIIEHKHFVFGGGDTTVITREYPTEWTAGAEPYYPVNDEKNQALYERYRLLAQAEDKVHFGGRLGQYRYFDMDKVVYAAMTLAKEIL